MVLMNDQITGNCYSRFNSFVGLKEYMGDAGPYESMHSENPQYFSRDTTGSTFGKPVLHLKTVCWMNPHAIVESIPIPDKKDNVVNLFFYHKYGPRFRFSAWKGGKLEVFFAVHGDGKT